ncbi:hypothetical protein GCM10010228_55820 [Streptomyces massasporeus]|nr:hypothetical protein GCM10010228_55820 [Streptomyces massasporeus]
MPEQGDVATAACPKQQETRHKPPRPVDARPLPDDPHVVIQGDRVLHLRHRVRKHSWLAPHPIRSAPQIDRTHVQPLRPAAGLLIAERP